MRLFPSLKWYQHARKKDEVEDGRVKEETEDEAEEVAKQEGDTESPSCADEEVSTFLHAMAQQEQDGQDADVKPEEKTVETKNQSTQTILFSYMMKEMPGDPEQVDEKQIARDARAAFKKSKKDAKKTRKRSRSRSLESVKSGSVFHP